MSFNKSNEVLAEVEVEIVSTSAWSKTFQRLEYVANIINQMCIGFVTIYMTWLCARNKMTGTSLHAWLVTIGFEDLKEWLKIFITTWQLIVMTLLIFTGKFQRFAENFNHFHYIASIVSSKLICLAHHLSFHFLMAEGIMCHYGNNVLTFSFKRKTKTTIHWVLQLLGGGCGVAGVIIQLVRDKFPLFSLHGKLGFAAFILCLVSMLSGLVALLSGPLRRLLSPLLNKTLHNFLGIATFTLALVAQFYGYKMHLITRNAPMDFEILIQCVTLVALVLTCIGPLKAFYNKISTMMGYE